jgi:hypothetical protein
MIIMSFFLLIYDHHVLFYLITLLVISGGKYILIVMQFDVFLLPAKFKQIPGFGTSGLEGSSCYASKAIVM